MNRDFNDVFVRRVLPKDLSLIYVIYNRFNSALRDQRPPTAEEIMTSYKINSFDLTRLICVIEKDKERIVGLFSLIGTDKVHGFAEGGIYYVGKSMRDRIAFTLGLAIGTMQIHLEERIFTCLSEIILPNDASVNYTLGTMNFKKLGVIPKIYFKDGIAKDCLFSYGNFLTTYEGMKQLDEKGIKNEKFTELLEKAKVLADQIKIPGSLGESGDIVVKQSKAFTSTGLTRSGITSIENSIFDTITPYGKIDKGILTNIPPNRIRMIQSNGGCVFVDSLDPAHNIAEICLLESRDAENFSMITGILHSLSVMFLNLDLRFCLWKIPDLESEFHQVEWASWMGFNKLGFIPGLYMIHGKRVGGHIYWFDRATLIKSVGKVSEWAGEFNSLLKSLTDAVDNTGNIFGLESRHVEG